MVDDENCISSESGEYFASFDWVGCALLLGVIAGSGNARVGQIKDFNILKQFNITNDMTKEEIQELLNAQKTELLATFEAGNQTVLKAFQEAVEVITTPPAPTEEVTETVAEIDPVEAPAVPTEPTAEELEDAEVLADVQMSLKNAEKRATIMASFKAEKLLSDRESDAPNAVTSPEYKTKSSFISNLI
jgi:hypothetical protein